MKVLLLANQPEKTTRLKLFEGTLKDLGYDVTVPSFGTVNWFKIASKAKEIIRQERPDVVHVFNVPDIIYHGLPALRGTYFKRLIYDYRSPWGVETQMRFGALARSFCERYEAELARESDFITTVNSPLRRKAMTFAPDKDPMVIPNYPTRSFVEGGSSADGEGEGAVLFVGRVCEQEGIEGFLAAARQIPDREFLIVGGGPFEGWYLRKKSENVRSIGWQPHSRVAAIVGNARLCLIPRKENVLTPYSTDKSIWKLNEYLNMGKPVVASGISREEKRKNLMIVESARLSERIREGLDEVPDPMRPEDYRFWDENCERIREVYEGL